jgi:hypothetical protein
MNVTVEIQHAQLTRDILRLSPLEEHALVCGWRGGDVTIMLYWFFDESGEHGPDGKLEQLTLGGFLARWRDVRKLCREWRVALDEFHISDFHMSEFASDEHRFDLWPSERQAKLDRFVDILCRHVTHFSAFSYKVTKPDDAFKDTYETALSHIMNKAASIATHENDRLRLVFAKAGGISSGRIGEYFDTLDWNRNHVHSIATELSRDNPPLQAAEIVARGLKNFVESGEISHSFQKVMSHAKDFDCWVHR